jgi:hypothetical protein
MHDPLTETTKWLQSVVRAISSITPFLVTKSDWERSGRRYFACGCGRYGAAASGVGGLGTASSCDLGPCSLKPVSSTGIQVRASPLGIRGKNHVRQTRQHGSLREVPSNRHPYRDRRGKPLMRPRSCLRITTPVLDPSAAMLAAVPAGGSPADGRCPAAIVVILGDEKGDRLIGSPGVNVSVGWE